MYPEFLKEFDDISSVKILYTGKKISTYHKMNEYIFCAYFVTPVFSDSHTFTGFIF